ncbi:MAG: hypothetical protein Q4D58_02330 [Synergistaceae bacterium]|nr:hypothetical protein [Synergistaceae bacterium]
MESGYFLSLLKKWKKGQKGAEAFLYDLLENEDIRLRLVEIARLLPTGERGEAVRAIGYDFTSREISNVVCRLFYHIPPERRFLFGKEDLRDVVMREWGNHM